MVSDIEHSSWPSSSAGSTCTDSTNYGNVQIKAPENSKIRTLVWIMLPTIYIEYTFDLVLEVI